MKNLLITLFVLASSLTLFSCTTDDSDLVDETEITTKEQAGIGEGHVAEESDPD